MHKFLFASVLSLAAFLFFLPAQLRADGLTMDTFTFTENIPGIGLLTLTWQLPANAPPTGGYTLGLDFIESAVTGTGTLAGNPPETVTGDLIFISTSNLINVIDLNFLDSLGVSLLGASQMYCGPESDPTFIPGVYNGFDLENAGAAATLTIVATPEPPSILMYLVGFLALAGVFLLRKAQG